MLNLLLPAGEIRTNMVFDYELQSEYMITITASDVNNTQRSATFNALTPSGELEITENQAPGNPAVI